MKLTVHKLGLIERAELDIRPCTVLVGPNGTNKTWVAYALYGLLRNLSPGQAFHIPGTRLTVAGGGERWRKDVQKMARPMARMLAGTSHAVRMVRPSVYVGTSVANIEGAVSFLKQVLRLEEGLSTKAKVRLRLAREELRSSTPGTSMLLHALAQDHVRAQLLAPEGPSGSTWGIAPPYVLQGKPGSQKWVATYLTARLFLQQHRVFILPAERKALASAHDLLRDAFTEVVSVPVADYARFLQWHRSISSRGIRPEDSSPLGDLARLLEVSVVQGAIGFRRGKTDNIFAFSPARSLHLPIHAASSLVRAVAGLDLYLQREAEPGDFVVIDELEMNAHPEAQLALTELVAMLVNRGLRVVMTTHSPYVVEHLNNLMAAARLPPRKQREIAARFRLKTHQAFLPADKVAAYAFTPSGREVRVSDVLDRAEDTIDWRTFSRVTDELGDIQAHILAAKRRS